MMRFRPTCIGTGLLLVSWLLLGSGAPARPNHSGVGFGNPQALTREKVDVEITGIDGMPIYGSISIYLRAAKIGNLFPICNIFCIYFFTIVSIANPFFKGHFCITI